MGESSVDDADTFRILVATDTHVGFCEKDKVRGCDSFNSFEEVLRIGQEKQVDFILHGGDLFHENKPSRRCLYKTMDLIRRYTFGSGAIAFQVLSDPSLFARGIVNYEDPNINVEIPVFLIHGNHDDPGGDSNLCAAHLLEAAGLVNYFGRADDLDDIVVRPVLLQKGRTQLAIYGLGNVRDERLHRAFQAHKVRFETPSNTDQWFNIMILHQNRHKGNFGGVPTKACIHEQMLPSFLDLVVWGHEHDCLVSPQESLRGQFYVVQPGSSIATQLTQSEAGLKHAAFIEVRMGSFRCVPVPLWSVRPLVMRDIVLSETGLPRTDAQAVWNSLTSEVDSLLNQGKQECEHRKNELALRKSHLTAPDMPLVRLRVEHTGFEPIGNHVFGQNFIGRVANSDDILVFHRKGGGVGGPAGKKTTPVGDILEIEEAVGMTQESVKIQDIVYKYVQGQQNLQLLTEPELNDAVQSYVHRAEACAIERVVKDAVESTSEAVLRETRGVSEEEIRNQIQDRADKIRQQRLAAAEAPGTTTGSLPQPNLKNAFIEPVDLPDRSAEVQRTADMSAHTAAPHFFLGAQARQGLMDDVVDTTPSSQRASGGRGGGRGRGGSRGRGSKRQLEEVGSSPAPLQAKKPNFARASGSVVGTGMQPLPGRSVQDSLFAGAAGNNVAAVPETGIHPSAAESAWGPSAKVGPRVEAPVPTEFLRKRNALGEAFQGGDSAFNAGMSLQKPSQTTTKRQWALRGPG